MPMSRNIPLVTIIVPVYKKFEYLKDTIDSILMQDYPRIELIITDDSSPNYKEEFVQGLLRNVPPNIENIKIIHHEKNLGTVKNLNYALKESTGDFISLLAGDDMYYESATLSKILAAFTKKDKIIVGRMYTVNVAGESKQFTFGPTHFINYYPLCPLYYFLIERSFIYTAPTAVYKKEVFEKIGNFDENFIYLEDFPFWLKVLRYNIQVRVLDESTCRYRFGAGGMADAQLSPIISKEIYLAYVKEYRLQPNTFWGNFIKASIKKAVWYMFQDIDSFHLAEKEPFKPLSYLLHVFFTTLSRLFPIYREVHLKSEDTHA